MNRDELAARLRTKAAEYGWGDWATAAVRAAALGLAARLNWADPFPALIDLAIERATADRLPPAG